MILEVALQMEFIWGEENSVIITSINKVVLYNMVYGFENERVNNKHIPNECVLYVKIDYPVI